MCIRDRRRVHGTQGNMALTADSTCILLIKMLKDENSRFYLDYASQSEAAHGVTRLYEQMLKQKNPDKDKLTYLLNDVFDFINQIHEITLLQYDTELKGFKPHGREWIKSMMAESFKLPCIISFPLYALTAR
eukprot:TRINITY_DN2853_c0_g1_i3.p2 TRINITY_DN2853_c0_g1~~TRINITY_DN2853_c0_g1_i3.p2  ORF type:complete len:132 (-),score=39.47 TRINITY_DN2853_c0_g1_i3:47-442(-)